MPQRAGGSNFSLKKISLVSEKKEMLKLFAFIIGI